MLKIGIVVFMLAAAFYTVTRKRPLEAIFGRTILGTLAVALYAACKAPDVALAEGLLGMALSTFVYITAFKSLGRIRIGCLVPQDTVSREIQNLLEQYARAKGYEVELVNYQAIQKATEALEEGYLDLIYSTAFPLSRPDLEVLPIKGKTEAVLILPKKSDLTKLFQAFSCNIGEEEV
jgi:putative multicomponent Na+:H+ antiporter subunit B